jgi:nicotinamide riboside kinase
MSSLACEKHIPGHDLLPGHELRTPRRVTLLLGSHLRQNRRMLRKYKTKRAQLFLQSVTRERRFDFTLLLEPQVEKLVRQILGDVGGHLGLRLLLGHLNRIV